MLLLRAATERGWAAVVGMPWFGAVAAHEFGVNLERLALVPNPGPDWATVVAALVDGVDMVAVAASGPVAEGTVRTLQARAREKGCVLVPTSQWPAASTTLKVTERRWEGLDHGRGRVKRQVLEVTASGRGAAARPRKTTVELGKPLADAAELVAAFPPAPDLPVPAAFETTSGVDLWSDLQPNEGPPDQWAELMHHLPRIERKKPWH